MSVLDHSYLMIAIANLVPLATTVNTHSNEQEFQFTIYLIIITTHTSHANSLIKTTQFSLEFNMIFKQY